MKCSGPSVSFDTCTGVTAVFVEHMELFRLLISKLQNDPSVDSQSELECACAVSRGVPSDVTATGDNGGAVVLYLPLTGD